MTKINTTKFTDEHFEKVERILKDEDWERLITSGVIEESGLFLDEVPEYCLSSEFDQLMRLVTHNRQTARQSAVALKRQMTGMRKPKRH